MHNDGVYGRSARNVRSDYEKQYANSVALAIDKKAEPGSELESGSESELEPEPEPIQEIILGQTLLGQDFGNGMAVCLGLSLGEADAKGEENQDARRKRR